MHRIEPATLWRARPGRRDDARAQPGDIARTGPLAREMPPYARMGRVARRFEACHFLPVVAVLATASGCFSMGKPAVMRSMTEMTSDGDKQHEQMSGSLARPDADSRKSLSKRARQVETVAASVAALVGMFYSTSPNVLPGVETDFDESGLGDPMQRQREQNAHRKHDADEAPPPPEGTLDPGQPVPWIRLAPPR
jgi:hypothetical protein